MASLWLLVTFNEDQSVSAVNGGVLTVPEPRKQQSTDETTSDGDEDILKIWMDAVAERDLIIAKLHDEAVRDDAVLQELRGSSSKYVLPPPASKQPVPMNRAQPVPNVPHASDPADTCDISWRPHEPAPNVQYTFSGGSRTPSKCITHPELHAVRCYITDLTVHSNKIDLAWGGEPLESKMGQIEDVEYAKYVPGEAFSTPDRHLLPQDKLSHGWYLNKVLAGMGSAPPPPNRQCSSHPTLFFQRYEYVNLFHTATDWWNIYDAVPKPFWDSGQKPDVVFLDGHVAGNLDEVWTASYARSVTPVKHLEDGACFNKAVVVSAGYASPIWLNNRSWQSGPCPQLAANFADHMLRSYDLEDVRRAGTNRVVIIDRAPYVAHPRSKVGKMPRTISNIDDLERSVRAAGGDVEVVRFEKLNFKEQLKAVREADILVGIHGAGLTHVLFMSDGSTMIELGTNSLGMFSGFAKWKPKVNYKEVKIGEGGGSYILTESHINAVLSAMT